MGPILHLLWQLLWNYLEHLKLCLLQPSFSFIYSWYWKSVPDCKIITYACRESFVKWERQLRGVGREGIPSPMGHQEAHQPGAKSLLLPLILTALSFYEMNSTSKIHPVTFATSHWAILDLSFLQESCFILCIHPCFSFHLKDSESRWAFRGLFLLCFASMHFQSITRPTWCGTLWQIDALSNTVWNFQLSFFSSGLSSTSCVIFKVFLFSIIHTLREEVPDFPGAAVLELQDRVSVVWNACSLGCGIWQGSLSVFRWEGAGSSALFQCSPSGGRLGNVIGRQVFQSGGGWKWKHLKHCLGMKLCCGKMGFQYDSFCRVRWKYNVDM